MTHESDTEEQQIAVQQLSRDEQALFLPLGLTLFALFSLGCATWCYLLDYRNFAIVLTVAGAAAIVLLVLCQSGGKTLLPLVRTLFGVQVVIMGFLILLLSPVGETGILGAICMAPVLIAIFGHRVGGVLLLANFAVFLALYKGLLPWQAEGYSQQMWVAFLGSYVAVGIFITAVDFYRNRSRVQLVEMTREFSHTASLDQLTELPNRREMERLLGGSINRYHLSGEAFSIIISDVDNYKQCNDLYGHQFGDQLLKNVSLALQQGLRSDDIVGRWGGDEFLVLLRGQKTEAAQQVAERLRRNVANIQLQVSGEDIPVTMSFGIACMEGHESGDELISTADRGLYQAKHMGRDMVVVG